MVEQDPKLTEKQTKEQAEAKRLAQEEIMKKKREDPNFNPLLHNGVTNKDVSLYKHNLNRSSERCFSISKLTTTCSLRTLPNLLSLCCIDPFLIEMTNSQKIAFASHLLKT